MMAPGILSEEESAALCERILSKLSASAAQVRVQSSARSTTEFARGDAHLAQQLGTVAVTLQVEVGGRHATVGTDQIDASGLDTLVRQAEALARENPRPGSWVVLKPQTYLDGPQLYYDATAEAMAAGVQAEIFRHAMEAAERPRLVCAGDVYMEAATRAVLNTEGLAGYEQTSYGEFSVTARTQDGQGSGWAWGGYEDWSRVDVDEVIARAVALGRRSADPVALEPGRYTVILEPAAVAELVNPIIGPPTANWQAAAADAGSTVFSKEPLGTNKIGLQMLDLQLGMVSSPWDPERPATTIGGSWTPIPGPVTWFEDGVLKNLSYSHRYAVQRRRDPVINPGGVRLEAKGGTQRLEEMIASTRRGIWVNRFSHVVTMDPRSLVLTGTTRDGTFLIEHGQITRPIRNLRFTESPFHAFNRLEAWGEPVRASRNVVVPRLMLGDFNFTSLTDAI